MDIYDKETDTWLNISEKEGLPSNYIRCLASDESYLWVGMGYQKGAIARLDLKTKEIHAFLPRDFPAQSPPPLLPITNIKIAGDFVWCTLDSGRNGVGIYDKQKNIWKYLPTKVSRITVFRDKVWLSGSFSVYDSPEERLLFSSEDPAKFRLERRILFNCEFNGDNWKKVSIKDGLSSMETDALDSDLLLGTYILKHFYPDGSTGHNYAYKLPCGLWVDSEVTQVLTISTTEIWIGTRDGIKILNTH